MRGKIRQEIVRKNSVTDILLIVIGMHISGKGVILKKCLLYSVLYKLTSHEKM